MAKALGFIVAVVIFEIIVTFRTVIPSEFQKPFPVCNRIDTIHSFLWNLLLSRITEKVEVELGIFVL
jgi:hypothetical protein